MNDRPIHKLEWTDERVDRFWSYHGNLFHAYFAENYGPAIFRKTAMHIPSSGTCIDYGCGSGGLTSALLAAGYRVGAVDFSPKSVAHVANRFAHRTNFLGARAISDIAGAAFPLADVVYSVETIEHVTDKHVDNYFSTIAHLLKPEGLAIFTTPNNEDIESAMVFCPESGAVFHPMQHVRSFDPRSLEQFVRAHGFEPVTTFVTDFSLSLRDNTKTWLADKGKRLLGMGAPPPHLVTITRRRN